MNDALHGREAWRRPGKRDRDRRREVGAESALTMGPGKHSDSGNPGSNPGPPARQSRNFQADCRLSRKAGHWRERLLGLPAQRFW
jgi:hypothetical protein